MRPDRRRVLRRPLLLALAGLALGAAAWGWVRLGLPPFVADDGPASGETLPPGRWHRFAPAGAGADREAEERARLISLPYSAGAARALPGAGGVVAFDPGRAAPGVNLYVSGHGPEAFLVDLEGRELARWRMPFARAFPGRAATVETDFFRRARRLADGHLLALIQTGGLIELDRDSRLVRARAGGYYNDFDVEGDLDSGGRVWTILKEAREVRPPLGPSGRSGPVAYALEDFLVALAPAAGEPLPTWEEVRRISLLEAFAGTPFEELLAGRRASGDVLHTNTVEILDGRLPSPLFAAGRALVSLREVDTVAVVDLATGKAVWAQRGPFRRQHQPVALASGRILLFDNLGRAGASRLLELDPATGGTPWIWAPPDPRSFVSEQAGSVQPLAGGNLLVTESESARAFELAPDGSVVWEFRNPHRAGRDGELVATLFEVVRYEAP